MNTGVGFTLDGAQWTAAKSGLTKSGANAVISNNRCSSLTGAGTGTDGWCYTLQAGSDATTFAGNIARASYGGLNISGAFDYAIVRGNVLHGNTTVQAQGWANLGTHSLGSTADNVAQ